jgi:hypothetical protein
MTITLGGVLELRKEDPAGMARAARVDLQASHRTAGQSPDVR